MQTATCTSVNCYILDTSLATMVLCFSKVCILSRTRSTVRVEKCMHLVPDELPSAAPDVARREES